MKKTMINLSYELFDKNIKIIKNFHVSFDLDYDFEKTCVETSKVRINYLIGLYDGKNKQIGQINCLYEFIVPENINFVCLNDDTKNRTLNYCLKFNHNEIKSQIMNVLKDNGIKIINVKEYYH